MSIDVSSLQYMQRTIKSLHSSVAGKHSPIYTVYIVFFLYFVIVQGVRDLHRQCLPNCANKSDSRKVKNMAYIPTLFQFQKLK